MAGRPLREASLPEGSIVLAIQRDTELLASSGDLTLAPVDPLTVLARPDRSAELRAALGTSP